MHLPELPLLFGAVRRLGGALGGAVDGERIVAEDEADLVAVVLLDLRDRLDGVPAHRAVRFHLDTRRRQEDVSAGRVAQLLHELGAARLQAAAAHSFRDLGQGLILRQTGVAFRDAFVHRLDVRHHRHDDLRFDLRLQQLLGRDVAPRGFGFDQLRGDQILEDAAADVEG